MSPRLCLLLAILGLCASVATGFSPAAKPVAKPRLLALRGGSSIEQGTGSSVVFDGEASDEPPAPKLASVGGLLAAVFAITAVLKIVTKVPTEGAGVISSGDTAWMLTSAAFVLLMTPGLGLFEAGLLRSKNSVSMIMQCFSGLAVLSLLWFVCGFSMCFGPTDLGVIASPFDHWLFSGVGWETSLSPAPTIPAILFAGFQCMFAAITPLLVTGAFAERLKFTGFLSFVVLWSLVCYYPMCHLIWGGGALAKWGVIDFAGGIVIHAIAGVASLVTATMLGPRVGFEKSHGHDEDDKLEPHSLMMALLGAGLLWMGWFGFNAGSAVAAGGLAANTLFVSHIAASAATFVWVLLDWTTLGKPTFVGAINGALSGLAGVTPASGFVHAQSGAVIGLLCGIASYYGVYFLKERLRIDDALDVSSVHGLTGIVGSLAIGLYASKAINPDGADGLFFGGGLSQLVKQLGGVGVACLWSLITTYGIMKLLDTTNSARVSSKTEKIGLDVREHGEAAYLY